MTKETNDRSEYELRKICGRKDWDCVPPTKFRPEVECDPECADKGKETDQHEISSYYGRLGTEKFGTYLKMNSHQAIGY